MLYNNFHANEVNKVGIVMNREKKLNKKNDIKEKNKNKKNVLLFVFSFIFILLAVSAIWSKIYFGKLSFNQIIYAISMPLKGTDHSLITKYIVFAILPSILLTYSLYHLYNKVVVRKFLDKLERRRRETLSKRILSLVTCIFVIIGLYFAEVTWNISGYISASNVNSNFIENHYFHPEEQEIKFPENKRNLIYIYLESMETSYQNRKSGGGFEVSRIPELTKLAEENISFSRTEDFVGGYNPYNTTWTIAGMVAQTAGLPLNIPVGRNQMSRFEEFMPGVTNLGDILEENGYKNYIMFGSDAKFAGRDNYYSQHGNYEIYDLKWALESGKLPEGKNDFWGFQDSRLFQYAKEKLREISKEDEPFNFTLLTVDTHAQDGYLNEYSSKLFDDQYSNVIRGSSRQVYDFVRWIQKQDWYENTTIILTGDHLTMDKDYDEEMDEDTIRGVYNCIINPFPGVEKNARLKNREFTTLDGFPTILAAIGCDIKDDSLGLGVNLFSDKETLAEIYSYEALDEEFKKSSEFYYKEFLGIGRNK